MSATGALPIDVERAGIVLAALLAAAAVLAPRLGRARAGAVAALAALVLTPVLLIGQIWDSSQFRPLREHPGLSIALGVVVLVALAAAAVLLRRRPGLLPLAAVAMLPFRLPIAVGGDTSNLLVPLYAVVAAGVLAVALPRALGARSESGSGAASRTRLDPRGRLEWLLLGFVVLYAVQASYSGAAGFSKALENVVFFYVPFALLFGLLVEIRWSPRLLRGCLAVICTEAAVFVLVGFYEYGTRHLLLNPKVISDNEFTSYFRVNSIFFDPSIYGRFLALVMLALAAALLWRARGRLLAGCGVLLALLWAGLVLSFSQSSFAALLVGLAALAALRFDVRRTVLAAAAIVVVGAVVVVAFPHAVRVDIGSAKSVDKATSGRYRLMKGGVELFGDRPVAGYGAGSFQRAYRLHTSGSRSHAVTASHTIPLTVAAEQGVIGLLVYLALLAAVFGRLYGGARADPARAYLAAAFTALVFHTLLYADFLEDPMTWAILGAGAALASARRPAVTPHR